MTPRAALLLALAALAALAAAEDDAATPWSSSGRASLQMSTVATGNAESSRDPAIAGTTPAESYVGTMDGTWLWRREPDSVEYQIRLQFGEGRSGRGSYHETADELRGETIYRHAFAPPHYVYGDGAVDTVFTGPEPALHHFDPVTLRASTGYGQLRRDLVPDSSRLDLRTGWRVQKHWGPSLDPPARDLEHGPEAVARFEQALWEDERRMLRWFAQAETFAEANDLRHQTRLVTAGLTVQVARFLSIDLGLRIYDESRPKELRGGPAPGYDRWSIRQEALAGLTWLW